VALLDRLSRGLFLLGFGVAACAREQPPPVYDCLVRVSSDPDTPLEAVSVLRDGQQVGVTSPDGSVRLRLAGVEGENVTMGIRCPEGYRQTSDGVSVILRNVADSAHVPEYSFVCPPDRRRIVVAIRADGGAHLPVLYLGRELTRTDRLGTAHVLLELSPDSQFELTLATTEGDARKLRPQNPTAKFFVHDQDDILSMVQSFAKPPPVKQARAPGPIRLESAKL